MMVNDDGGSSDFMYFLFTRFVDFSFFSKVKVSTVEVVPEQNHKELKRLSCDILKVCVAGFKKGKLKILMRFRSSTLMCSRHHVACEKLKKVLGAYPEAPLNIECLMEQVPFLYQDSLLQPAVR